MPARIRRIAEEKFDTEIDKTKYPKIFGLNQKVDEVVF